MYTRRVRTAARASRRGTRCEPVGSARAVRHRAAGARRARRWRWPSIAEAAAAVAQRLARAGVGASRPARSSCTSAPATRFGAGRSHRSRRWPRSSRAATARHRIVADVRSFRARRRRARHRGGARPSPEADRAPRPRVRRIFAGRAARACSTARRSTSAATAAPCTSPRRRRVPIVGLYGPTLPARSAPWRSRRSCPRNRSRPTACPAGPCDQRACEPGDFRCLDLDPAGNRSSMRRAALWQTRAASRPTEPLAPKRRNEQRL